MTNEEAIAILDTIPTIGEQVDALEMAIEALQERKTGKWKEVYAETDYRDGWIEFCCEFCEYRHGLESGEYGWSYGEPIPWKYCPICGAKMEVDE